jgi:myo-inositol-1(or 4)-monophosphatase
MSTGSHQQAHSFDLESLLLHAVDIIGPVGEFLMAQKVSEAQIETKSLNSLVSHVDKQAEAQLVEGLSRILPEAGFLAEEGSGQGAQGHRYCWVVDPLDGTTNLIHGLPVFCVSVALVDGDEPVLAVVHDPNREECFTAIRGGGAHLNGRPIRCSSRENLADALVATGVPHWDFSQMDAYLRALTVFAKGSRGLRRMGSAAIDLAYVACGRFDAFFEYSLQPWDIAAGLLLVQEAGGVASDFQGSAEPGALLSGKETFASAPGISAAAFSVVQSAFG